MNPLQSLKRLLGRNDNTPAPFIGFRHPHGVGIRTKNYVMPLSREASGFARALAADAGLTLIENSATPSDLTAMNQIATTFLPQLGRHRHTAGIFLVAVGDEPISAQEISSQIYSLGTPCEYMIISDCPDMETAINLAMGTAQELKSMSLSGLENIDKCDLTISYQEEPACLVELVALLEKNNFVVRAHQMSASKRDEMSTLAMEGSHAILSFEAEDQYPAGTLVTPVINVASESDFHRLISGEFDLSHESSPADILHKVQQTFGMVPTISEALGTFESLFDSNLPSLNDVAEADEICLLPTNPVLIPFLIDLVSHQAGFFLKDWESFDRQEVPAKKILVVGTGGAGDAIYNSLSSDPRSKKLTLAEFGSLHGLAAAILAEA
jgi:hypothetical protein